MEKWENIRLPWQEWKIVKYLGGGGYGKVYEIERNTSGICEKAAVKIISRPQDAAELESYYDNGYDRESIAASYEEEIQNYIKEYQIMKDLQGQSNVVSCDDFAVIPGKDGIGGSIYIRMELLTPLQKATKQRALREQEIIKLGMDICRALELCESKKIIHRDIKPENILISQFGDFKLGDFGVARVMDHTTNATKMGTHGYAAPEVEHMQKYGKEADIYSLGITLYWLLNNRRMPFLSADEMLSGAKVSRALAKRYSGEKLPMPRDGNTQLKRIVLKACEYHPGDRYASAREMYEELKKISLEQETAGAAYKTADYAQYETVSKDGNFGYGQTAGNAWCDTDATIGKPQAAAQKKQQKKDGDTIAKTMGKPIGKKEVTKEKDAVTPHWDKWTYMDEMKEITAQWDAAQKKQQKKDEDTIAKTMGKPIGKKEVVKEKNTVTPHWDKWTYMDEMKAATSRWDALAAIQSLHCFQGLRRYALLCIVVFAAALIMLLLGWYKQNQLWIVGMVMVFAGGYIDNCDDKRVFDAWLKDAKAKVPDLDTYIETDLEFGIQLYFEKSWNKMTFKYIRKLNADTAKEIERRKPQKEIERKRIIEQMEKEQNEKEKKNRK